MAKTVKEMTTFLTILVLKLGWHSHKYYEVINPKYGEKVVLLCRLDGPYDDVKTEEIEKFTLYMSLDSIVYKESEIVKLSKKEFRNYAYK
jgi:hypothetical protein